MAWLKTVANRLGRGDPADAEFEEATRALAELARSLDNAARARTFEHRPDACGQGLGRVNGKEGRA